MATVKKNLVLIIEDEFDISNMFKVAAELVPDYDIEIIEDGTQALKRLEKDRLPNVVILDLHLPYVEGDEFLRSARKDPGWENVPIYIVTGDAKAADRHLRHPEGANGVFVKGAMSIDEIQVMLYKHKHV